MIVICIKQHLSNIWSSIHEKAKQYWGRVEKKSVAYKKPYSIKLYIFIFSTVYSLCHHKEYHPEQYVSNDHSASG